MDSMSVSLLPYDFIPLAAPNIGKHNDEDDDEDVDVLLLPSLYLHRSSPVVMLTWYFYQIRV